MFNNKYLNEQVLQIRTTEKISLREKVTNIRDSEDSVIWSEQDFPSDTPTVFEVIGVTPLTDPFGKVIAFSTSLKRSENQIIGI
jgi:hypothetical protein